MMTIGKLAKLTNATCKAIRHYEAIGLIPEAQRVGKYRVYSAYDVLVIQVIRRALTLGFSLMEIKELVAYKVKHKKFPLQIANELIILKKQAHHAEIQRLATLNQQLDELQNELATSFAAPPIIEE